MRPQLSSDWGVAFTIGLIVTALAVAVGLYFNRPPLVEVAAAVEDAQTRIFGLGTVEARMLSKVGF